MVVQRHLATARETGCWQCSNGVHCASFHLLKRNPELVCAVCECVYVCLHRIFWCLSVLFYFLFLSKFCSTIEAFSCALLKRSFNFEVLTIAGLTSLDCVCVLPRGSRRSLFTVVKSIFSSDRMCTFVYVCVCLCLSVCWQRHTCMHTKSKESQMTFLSPCRHTEPTQTHRFTDSQTQTAWIESGLQALCWQSPHNSIPF